MQNEAHTNRRAGVALPLSSLRGADDVGSGTILDLLPFIDWCAVWQLRLIQLLPLNEAAPSEASPYRALSAFAVDPSYISARRVPEVMASRAAQSWLATEQVQRRIAAARQASSRDRKLSHGINARLLEFAFAELEAGNYPERRAALDTFCRQQAEWLDEYALFRALSERRRFSDWQTWPAEVRGYNAAVQSGAALALAPRLRFAKYIQWLAWEQWQQVHAHARRHDVLLKGDVAFMCAPNSADVWAHPEWFDLRSSAGTPPDAFSATGQMWDLPISNWEAQRQSGYEWWRRRARQAGRLFDVFRVDHVVGLYRTYAIAQRHGGASGFVPPDEETQRRQGHEILQAIQEEASPALVVGEDLGTIPDWVRTSLHELGIPGYKVFRWEQRDGQFIDPHTYSPASVVTTSTHDTDTLVEWWATLPAAERHAVCAMLGIDTPDSLPWQPLLRRLLGAPSRLAVFPLQDLLQWTERINVPATVGEHNWGYRLPIAVDQLERAPGVAALLEQLRALILASGR